MPTLSFGACGFHYPYYVGVCDYILDHFQVDDETCVIATSGGNYVALPFLIGMRPYDWMMRDFPMCIKRYRKRWLGPCLDSKEFYKDLILASKTLSEVLPSDEFPRRLSDRLYIHFSQFWRLMPKSVFISNFCSKEDYLEAFLASCNFGLHFWGPVTSVRGQWSWDGAFSESCPRLRVKGIECITVSPLRSADICPADDQGPTLWTALRCPDMERCVQLARLGYADAARRHQLFLDRGWRPAHSPAPRLLHPALASIPFHRECHRCAGTSSAVGASRRLWLLLFLLGLALATVRRRRRQHAVLSRARLALLTK